MENLVPDMNEVEILKLKLQEAKEERDIYFKAWMNAIETQMANYQHE